MAWCVSSRASVATVLSTHLALYWLLNKHTGVYTNGYATDELHELHYNDVIVSAMASQITSLTIAYSTVYSGAGQRKHQSSASMAFVRGIHRWPVNSPHKWPVTRKMFPFDNVIMKLHGSDAGPVANTVTRWIIPESMAVQCLLLASPEIVIITG